MGKVKKTKRAKPRSLSAWRYVALRRAAKLLKILNKLENLEIKKQYKGGFHGHGLQIDFVNAKKMQELNNKYRKKDYVTDVLSFPVTSEFRVHGQLGQIVICLPKLLSQSALCDHASGVELQILLVHGLLHLLGFDHEKDINNEKEMKALEVFLIKKSGFSPRSALMGRE